MAHAGKSQIAKLERLKRWNLRSTWGRMPYHL
jgi:hypothetical protein